MTKQSGVVRALAVSERAHEMRREHPDWRMGQALFNALDEIDPEFANTRIRGTYADPFHDDARIPDFGRAVSA